MLKRVTVKREKEKKKERRGKRTHERRQAAGDRQVVWKLLIKQAGVLNGRYGFTGYVELTPTI